MSYIPVHTTTRDRRVRRLRYETVPNAPPDFIIGGSEKFETVVHLGNFDLPGESGCLFLPARPLIPAGITVQARLYVAAVDDIVE